MSTGTGVNVSKAVAYAELNPPKGAGVSKAVAYAELGPANTSPPSWPVFTFSSGVVNVAYSQSWDMPSAAQTVTYTVVSGSLPTGLSLSALTGNQAKIAGTPTTAGVYSFTLRGTNTYGTADKAFSLTIVAPAGGGAWTWLS